MSRKTTRHDEGEMWALWRLVRERAMGRTIRATCEELMQAGKVRIEGSATIVTAELLRQRYQASERARQQPDKYPIFAAKAEQWLRRREARELSQLAAVRLAVEHELSGLPDATTRKQRNRLPTALGKVLLAVATHPTAPLSVRLLPHCESLTALRRAYKQALALPADQVQALAWAEFTEPEQMAHAAEIYASLSRDGFPRGEGLKGAAAHRVALGNTYAPQVKRPR